MSGQPSRQPPSHPARPIIPATMPSSKNRKQPIGHGVSGSIADFHSAAPVFGSRLLVRVPPVLCGWDFLFFHFARLSATVGQKYGGGHTKRRIPRQGASHAAPSHRESVSGSGSGQERAAEKRGKRGKGGGNKTKAIALQTRLHAWNHISTSRRTSHAHAEKGIKEKTLSTTLRTPAVTAPPLQVFNNPDARKVNIL